MPILSNLNWLDYYSTDEAGLLPVDPDASIEFLQVNGSETDLTTYTFAGENLGVADPARHIIVAVSGRQTAARTISSVTVGGVTATLVKVKDNGSTNTVALYVAAVPTGTTGDVVVVWSGGMLRCGIALYRALNINPTAEATGESVANPMTSDLIVSAGSVQVAIGYSRQASITHTWTGTNGPTEDFDAAVASTNNSWSGASRTSPAALTVTATDTPSTSLDPSYVSASFARA